MSVNALVVSRCCCAGERVTARLQASTLSALSGASDGSGRAQSGGSFMFAALNSTDDPARTIATVGKLANTAANLGTESNINRYGYSSARDAAAVTVRHSCSQFGARCWELSAITACFAVWALLPLWWSARQSCKCSDAYQPAACQPCSAHLLPAGRQHAVQ